MKRLFISIIIAVLGSLFLIGWGLDKFVADHSDVDESTDIAIYQQLVEGFNQQLSQQKEIALANSTKLIAQQFQMDISIESAKSIALPQTLTSQLSVQGGLLLASDEQAYILKKITQHPNWLIRLQLPIENNDDQELNMLLTAVLYLGVCAILMLWLFPLARRLFVLTNAAARIGKGEVDVRVTRSKFSYISPLEKSFNHMAAQIEKLMADNKILARSLSHDIRTPMSCLRFGVEAALDCKDVDKKNTYLLRMENELTRMEEMTSAFLAYAGMERQGINLKLQSVDVNKLIKSTTDNFQTLAQQHEIKLTCQLLTKPCYSQLDLHWMNQALQNLISNAVQYASSVVTLTIKTNPEYIEIYIEDDGKGIATDKLNVVFDPFVKLDVDRSREKGHFGLGLAICAKVINWHKGKISAQPSETLSGACFIIQLPK
jgi:signal transduction histidine kinase